MPRSGSLKLWNSSMTTALTSVKSKASLMEQAVEEDLGHDDEHPGVRVLAPVAGDQADVIRVKAPANRRRLHLAELLLGERDQRRRVVGRLAGVQGLEQRRLGDERLARARRRADQDALVGGKPGQQRLFLDRVGLVGELLEIALGDVVARERRVGHGGGSRRGRAKTWLAGAQFSVLASSPCFSFSPFDAAPSPVDAAAGGIASADLPESVSFDDGS